MLANSLVKTQVLQNPKDSSWPPLHNLYNATTVPANAGQHAGIRTVNSWDVCCQTLNILLLWIICFHHRPSD